MINSLITVAFILGYCFIVFEKKIKIDKTSSAIITGVVCWTFYIFSGVSIETISRQLMTHMGEIAGILFFLLGAMTIVELIDAHDGFSIISNKMKSDNKRTLLWVVGFITFSLSAVLDNLTTTIVMVLMIRTLLSDEKERWIFTGIIIIAANSGGAWSPLGDVTTTMLWIGGQITAWNIIQRLILPSLVSVIIPLIIATYMIKRTGSGIRVKNQPKSSEISNPVRYAVLIVGIAGLLFVPLFKSLTHLPPFMGMLLSLGIIWAFIEVLHRNKNDEEKVSLSVTAALRRLNIPTILFFLGILLAVSALESSGLLKSWALALSGYVSNQNVLILIIGFFSSVIDNVPLVAAIQGMYSLNVYPMDHYFWEFLAYASGTGGSILIIGSAAGIAAMGMEKISFFWFLKRFSLMALLGYLAGAYTYIVMTHFLI
jgi:Na+/H+ antiporter NhaD/arsenite permease-like protein